MSTTGLSLANFGGGHKSCLVQCWGVKCTSAKSSERRWRMSARRDVLDTLAWFSSGRSQPWAGLMLSRRLQALLPNFNAVTGAISSSSGCRMIFQSWVLAVNHLNLSTVLSVMVERKDVEISVTLFDGCHRNTVPLPSVDFPFKWFCTRSKTYASLTRKWTFMELRALRSRHLATSSWTMKAWPLSKQLQMWRKVVNKEAGSHWPLDPPQHSTKQSGLAENFDSLRLVSLALYSSGTVAGLVCWVDKEVAL